MSKRTFIGCAILHSIASYAWIIARCFLDLPFACRSQEVHLPEKGLVSTFMTAFTEAVSLKVSLLH